MKGPILMFSVLNTVRIFKSKTKVLIQNLPMLQILCSLEKSECIRIHLKDFLVSVDQLEKIISAKDIIFAERS